MNWANVKRIWLRELRDQLRDRRTLFTVAVLPVLLYPLMGIVVLQVSQFTSSQPVRVWLIGTSELPESPPLLIKSGEGYQLAGEGDGGIELKITPEAGSIADPGRAARDAIHDGAHEVVVCFPADYKRQIAGFRRAAEERPAGAEARTVELPMPQIHYSASKEKSRLARDRIQRALEAWGDKIIQKTQQESRIPLIVKRPLDYVDVAQPQAVQSLVWSKILPFVLMVWAMTGAFYPAIDLCAGEKERGTLETLLTSPAQRSEIVWGKLLAVMTFSAATAMLNLASMVLTGMFVLRAIGASAPVSSPLELGPPPIASLGWLLLALAPAAAMFSALALAIAAMARSSKEGQYYLMPLLLVSLPLMVLPIMPAAELTLGTSLVPITGLIMLLRRLIEGEYLDALRYALPVIGVTMLCVWLSIRWCIDQFSREEVLFRESERFTLGLWLRHLVRDRRPTPTLAAALFCGALLLVLRFFAMFVLPPSASWNEFALTTIATLAGLIALPPVLLSLLLTSSPRTTFLLQRWPSPLVILAAAALALCLAPVVHAAGSVVSYLFPVSKAMDAQLQAFQQILGQSPHPWLTLAVLALAPAVCEELAYRGFVLSGLRHMGHKWGAIVLSAVLFGVAHGILQQSIMAAATGVVLGFLAVQTGSLLPCIVYHFVHNSSAVLLAALDEGAMRAWPALQWVFVPVKDGYAFGWPAAAAGGLLAAALLAWLARLPHPVTREEELQQALAHRAAAAGRLFLPDGS